MLLPLQPCISWHAQLAISLLAKLWVVQGHVLVCCACAVACDVGSWPCVLRIRTRLRLCMQTARVLCLTADACRALHVYTSQEPADSPFLRRGQPCARLTTRGIPSRPLANTHRACCVLVCAGVCVCLCVVDSDPSARHQVLPHCSVVMRCLCLHALPPLPLLLM